MALSFSRTHADRPKAARGFYAVYIATLIFAFHWSLVAYVNSTYLYQFVSDKTVGVLYIIASLFTIAAFLYIPRILCARGNYWLTIALGVAETALLIGIAIAPVAFLAVTLFVLHHALVPLLIFTIDIFMEHRIGTQENVTGGKRGLQLAIVSIGYALATLCGGLILGAGEPRFVLVYLASALCMVGFCLYVRNSFKQYEDSSYNDIHILKTFRSFWTKRDLRFVFLAYFLLQFFFAWMVIYVPLYLSSVIGFAWNEIGFILFVGLFAYVLFEYPIGKIADRWIGEKEMMAVGFIVLAITTAYIAFLKTPLLIPWMVTMFMTRLGASLVEVTTESYFFKHTKDSDANSISFFRSSSPVAYMLGALAGTLTLLLVPFNYAFLLLGIAMVPGVVFALFLKDTR